MKAIKAKGAPSPASICGKRPSVAQSAYNPMIRCPLKPRHHGPHAWKKI